MDEWPDVTDPRDPDLPPPEGVEVPLDDLEI